MSNSSSGTTSEYRENNAASAQTSTEPEQQRLVDESAGYFSGRSRKSSDDFASNAASSVSNASEDSSAQEARPRTTTLSSMNDAESSRVSTSHFYGPSYAAAAREAGPSDGDLDSEPSTPLVAPPPPPAVPEVTTTTSKEDSSEQAAHSSFKREHRPAPLQLQQKFPSTNELYVGSARQSHAAPGAPLFSQGHQMHVKESTRQPQSTASTPASTHRRSRSSSLPLTRERPDSKSRRRRTVKNSVDWTSTDSPTADKSGSSKTEPLSQFHLLTLHQLNLPRPASLSSNSSARLWTNAAHKRYQNGPYQSSINTNLYAPSLVPPIGLATLKELDLGEILRNPQLRHDIVFDPNLVFRPNFDGTRGQKKIEASDRYWAAVEREITTGCRCTVFNEAGQMLPCVCHGAGLATLAVDALCQRGGHSPRQYGQCTPLNSLPLATRLPSRISPLVAELRAILLSLLPTQPSSPTFNPSNARSLDAPSAHAIIESALDPDLVRQEVEHGVLDVASLARFLGDTLRMHCAPMRDEMVDSMVSLIAGANGFSTGKSTTQGLQMAFEILELMKLDIANHQLRTLRPYLLETALEFELRGCLDFADRAKTSAFSRTNAWTWAAAARAQSQQPFKVVTEGVLQSVFSTEGFDAAKWDRHAVSLATRDIPETLQLDLHRIRLFHSDVTDITIIYMLSMLFQSLAGPGSTEAQLDTMCQDIWVLMQSNQLVRGATSPTDASSMPSTPALSRVSKMETVQWRQGMSDIMLQIAARAIAIKNKRHCDYDMVVPDQQTLTMLRGWMNTNLRPSAPLFKLLQKRLKVCLQQVIIAEYGPKSGSASSSWWMRSVSPPAEATIPLVLSPSAIMASGQCSRASRLLDLPVAPPSSGKPWKRRRADGVEEDSPRKKRRVGFGGAVREAVEDTDIEMLLKKNGLFPLRYELQSLSDRIGKVIAFNVEVWEVLYSQLLSS